jgi:hypothetical protein
VSELWSVLARRRNSSRARRNLDALSINTFTICAEFLKRLSRLYG